MPRRRRRRRSRRPRPRRRRPGRDRSRPRRQAGQEAEAAAEAAGARRAPEQAGLGLRIPPTDVSAPLSPSGYVFPVYGPSSFTDTFRPPRAGVGWHHGEDIFAPLGAPLLAAVADGTVFSVGWNDRGGYRLWLRDRQGNQFYYAHLSAFSPLAVDGNEVKAGDVIGFVGNTGDAQTTPYHLHFEIHPVGLLPLGYDGVVNAFPYLSAWRRLEDVTFAAGRGWAPPVPRTRPRRGRMAILLGSTGHLERQRPRSRLSGPALTPGLPGRRRHARGLPELDRRVGRMSSCRRRRVGVVVRALARDLLHQPGPVCGPVIGLKRMPAVIPASRSIVLRALWSSLPWIRFAAVRSSSTVFFRLS